VIEISVPLVYDSSTSRFSENAKIGLNETVKVAKQYSGTATEADATIKFAGTHFA